MTVSHVRMKSTYSLKEKSKSIIFIGKSFTAVNRFTVLTQRELLKKA